MNKLEETLVILMEECSEVSIEASKLMRWSLDGHTDKLQRELGDLLCMYNLVHEFLDLDQELTKKYSGEKLEKLKKYSKIVN
jgi:NTP pyrophosphatase (non-canonical NTP hydrolase)